MAKLRVEFCRIGEGRGRLGGQIDVPGEEPLGAVTLDVGAGITPPELRPSVPEGVGTVFASLLAIESAVYAAFGALPDPGQEPRLLLIPGHAQLVHVRPGQAIAAVLAPGIATGSAPGAVAIADRSGTLAAGAVAQNACGANAARRLLVVANPDEARTLWFNMLGPATAGPGSLQVGPGGAFVFDTLVPSGAVSIIGAASGQPFTVQEA